MRTKVGRIPHDRAAALVRSCPIIHKGGHMFREIAADRLECSRSPPHPPLAGPAPGAGRGGWERGGAGRVPRGGVRVGGAVLERGWRWSEHVKPIAGTSSCEVAHTGYVIAGRLRVVMDDGSEGEAGPGG